MFIESLFTIAKIWKQYKYPSIGKWIEKLFYIYTYTYIYIYIYIHAYMPIHTYR